MVDSVKAAEGDEEDKVWEDNWEDDNLEDDFANKLRIEITNQCNNMEQ